jgi:hypothetical protein
MLQTALSNGRQPDLARSVLVNERANAPLKRSSSRDLSATVSQYVSAKGIAESARIQHHSLTTLGTLYEESYNSQRQVLPISQIQLIAVDCVYHFVAMRGDLLDNSAFLDLA